MQYLAGDIAVKGGQVLPLRCSHNTVRMQWLVEEAEYLNLAAADIAFPARHFSMLANCRRAEVGQKKYIAKKCLGLEGLFMNDRSFKL